MFAESTINPVVANVPILSGRAYREIRLKLNRALLALDIGEVSRSLVVAEFSRLYRSLPDGHSVNISIEAHSMLIRISFGISVSESLATALASVISYFRVSRDSVIVDSDEIRIRFWREYNATNKINLTAAGEILSLKTSEEIRLDAQGAREQLGSAQSKLQTVEKDLQTAADIQMHMLLSKQQLKAASSELDCHAYIVPCKDIGGDLYDLIPLGGSRFALAVGDVSGKGVPAALMMATCTTLIRAYSESCQSPAEIIRKTNQRLLQGNEADCMFTTLILVIVDCNAGSLVYCNAGHNPGVVCRSDGSIVSLDSVHGPALGVIDDHDYEDEVLAFGSGDRLLLYTDGVSESFSEDGQIYGHQRILDYCSRISLQQSSRRFLGGLLLDINAFSSGALAHDDVTLLAVRRMDLPQALHLQAMASYEDCAMIKDRIEVYCQERAVPAALLARLLLVLDELLTNIVMHADVEDGEVPRIELTLSWKSRNLSLELRDTGPPFNPFSAPAPDTALDLDERSIGGLGLLLVQSITTNFAYSYDQPWNCIMLQVPCSGEDAA